MIPKIPDRINRVAMAQLTAATLSFLLPATGAAAASSTPPAADFAPFVIPADVSERSAIAVSNAPIAPNGPRVAARGGRFEAGDERFRAWGVNLCYGANFPSHEDAERLAARLAAFGINSVRCHHMDAHAFPRGIWDPDDPTALSTQALDRLDYFAAQLARQGIRINLNLHVSRSHSRAESMRGADSLPPMDKIAGLFIPALIEAQQRYARNLLDRVNPYRGVRWADDPVLAFVEISNEDSFFMPAGIERLKSLPSLHTAKLESRFREWLRGAYGTTDRLRAAWSAGAEPLGRNVLANSDFSLTNTATGLPHAWVLDLNGGAAASVRAAPETGHVRIENIRPTGVNWHIQMAQSGLTLAAGRHYTVSFRARADTNRTIWVSVMQAHPPWRAIGLSEDIEIGPEWRDVRRGFRAAASDDNARVSFGMGGSAAAVEFADVRFRAGGCDGLRRDESLEAQNVALFPESETPARTTDRLRFLAEVEKDFYDGMREYLKREVKCPALVTGTALYGPLGLYAQSGMDYADAHAYWQHPRFPNRAWDPADWFIEQKAMAENPAESPLFQLAAIRPRAMPFTVSEYNHPAPNDYQAETVPLIAAWAAAQDWDGVWIFSYSHRTNDLDRRDFSGFFDIDANPAKWGFMPAGSAIFRQGGMTPLKDFRMFPLPPDPAGLAGLHLAYGQDMLRWLSEQEGADWPDLLGARMALSPTGTRLVTRIAPGRGEKRYPDLRWTPSDGFSARDARALVRACRAGGSRDDIIRVHSPEFAVVTVTACDGMELWKSQRVLITACGRCENDGMGFSSDRRTVGAGWGRAPARIQPVTATLRLPLKAGRWQIRPLGSDGIPLRSDPLDPSKPVALSAGDRTLWRLLVWEP